MARHNRDGRGTDQRGADYDISYQPDWLSHVRITRNLESGRQSTKTLFRNTGWKEQSPGPKVRTRITCREQDLDFEVALDDPRGAVRRITVETVVPGSRGGEETIVFTFDEAPPAEPHGGA